jgi:DNA-binding CsgD family transcriptional regulator
MRPIDICERLGAERITAICEQLNSNQLKTTLRNANIKTKLPSRVVS